MTFIFCSQNRPITIRDAIAFSYPGSGIEGIVLGSNFRNEDFDGFTLHKDHFRESRENVAEKVLVKSSAIFISF